MSVSHLLNKCVVVVFFDKSSLHFIIKCTVSLLQYYKWQQYDDHLPVTHGMFLIHVYLMTRAKGHASAVGTYIIFLCLLLL